MYGIISGWKGGGVDNVMQRIIEIISSVPNLIIVVLMLVVLKPEDLAPLIWCNS